MICKKCNRELPSDALFCCYCGVGLASKPKTPKKRGNGQGTVYKLPNGKWRATVTIAYDCENKRKTISRQFSRKTDAVLALSEMRNLTHSNVLYDITFGECLDKALEHKQEIISEKTAKTYIAIAKKFDNIRKMKITDVRTEHLQKCFDEVENYKTKNIMRTISHLTFQYALKNDIVSKDYTDYVELGKNNSERHEPFTMEEVVKFKRAADAGNHAAQIMMCLICTGMRPTELFQLKKTDYYDNCFHGGIKTNAGKNRVVPVNSMIQPYVEAQLQSRSEYLFANPLSGKQINVANFRMGMYSKLVKSIGIDDTKSPYSARHTFATMLNQIENASTSRDLVSRQQLMGHSDIEMTKHYTHADIEQLQKLTDGVSEIVCNAVCNSTK